MKSTFFLLLVFSFSQLYAQKVDLRKEIVYADKDPICKFLTIGTITNQAYTIKSMQDEELILIDQSQLRNAEGNILLRFMFADMPNKEAFMPIEFGFKKQLARLIVTYNLIENGKLNVKGVDRFCRNYNGYLKSNKLPVSEPSLTPEITKSNSENNENKNDVIKDDLVKSNELIKDSVKTEIAADRDKEYEYPIIERDADQPIFLSGTTIRQDFKDIGTYSAQTTTTNNVDGYQIIIKDINGIKVAEANYANGEGECDLLTMKDDKRRRVTIPKADVYSVVKDVVSKLSYLLYL